MIPSRLGVCASRPFGRVALLFPGPILGKRGMARDRTVRVEVFLVSRNPVSGYIALCRRQSDFLLANQLMQTILKRVLEVRVPGGRGVRLRPEIVDVVGAPQ